MAVIVLAAVVWPEVPGGGDVGIRAGQCRKKYKILPITAKRVYLHG